ncbi:MAG TPA: L,D-transpeptidase [Ktedonobacterales bacterium]
MPVFVRRMLVVLALVCGVALVSGGSALIAASGAHLPATAISYPPGHAVPGDQTITLWRAPGANSGPGALPSPTACACIASARVAPPPQINAPAPYGGVPQVGGKVILVSLAQQWLWAYQDQQLIYATPVTTGRPELPTPQGTFQIGWKVTDIEFISPWPPGSPFYYSPVHVNYAMLFLDGGFFLHDATWRHYFGPGTNVPHTNPDGTQETGSHGCVEMPLGAAAWLYGWSPYSTTVVIR